MMIQAVLGNPNHPEYGVATIVSVDFAADV